MGCSANGDPYDGLLYSPRNWVTYNSLKNPKQPAFFFIALKNIRNDFSFQKRTLLRGGPGPPWGRDRSGSYFHRKSLFENLWASLTEPDKPPVAIFQADRGATGPGTLFEPSEFFSNPKTAWPESESVRSLVAGKWGWESLIQIPLNPRQNSEKETYFWNDSGGKFAHLCFMRILFWIDVSERIFCFFLEQISLRQCQMTYQLMNTKKLSRGSPWTPETKAIVLAKTYGKGYEKKSNNPLVNWSRILNMTGYPIGVT